MRSYITRFRKFICLSQRNPSNGTEFTFLSNLQYCLFTFPTISSRGKHDSKSEATYAILGSMGIKITQGFLGSLVMEEFGDKASGIFFG